MKNWVPVMLKATMAVTMVRNRTFFFWKAMAWQ